MVLLCCVSDIIQIPAAKSQHTFDSSDKSSERNTTKQSKAKQNQTQGSKLTVVIEKWRSSTHVCMRIAIMKWNATHFWNYKYYDYGGGAMRSESVCAIVCRRKFACCCFSARKP